MESKIWSTFDGHDVVQWVIFLALVGFFLYKEAPGFWDRVRRKVQGEARADSLTARLDRIESDVQEIKEKLSRDYNRINEVESKQERDQRIIKDIKQEQGIIMNALLGVLSGLQELGANGETEKSKQKIITYLNDRTHDGGD